MKQFKWIPKKESGLEGYVMVSVPSHVARLELLRSIKFKVTKDGILEEQIDFVEKQKQIIEIAMGQIKEVDLTHKKTGSVLKSVDDLSYSSEGYGVLNDIGTVLINGVSLGELQGVNSNNK